MCQVRLTREPLAHSVLAWLTMVCRLATSAAVKPSSPPHRPDHLPVMECAWAVYWDGLLSGSLLWTPLTTWLPVIWRRKPITLSRVDGPVAKAGDADSDMADRDTANSAAAPGLSSFMRTFPVRSIRQNEARPAGRRDRGSASRAPGT